MEKNLKKKNKENPQQHMVFIWGVGLERGSALRSTSWLQAKPGD